MLRKLEHLQKIYWVPSEPFATGALIPCFKAAETVDCMVGYFSSAILSELAPGLAEFISRTQNQFRLIISPHISDEDRKAIEEGTVGDSKSIIESNLHELIITEDSLQKHTLRCLSWLIQNKRIEIKVVLVNGGMFHPKAWIFRDTEDTIVAHGSSNATSAGIGKNVEHINISNSWDNQAETSIFDAKFRSFWNNREDKCRVFEIPEAIKCEILKTCRPDAPPTPEEFDELYKKAVKQPTTQVVSEHYPLKREFSIPEHLQYETGNYAHQGQAVNAWCQNGFKGILEMATGSGKTITAMICAYKLFQKKKPLLIVISAPYKPLIEQWCGEVRDFGVDPKNLSEMRPSKRRQELGALKRQLKYNVLEVAVLVVSQKMLAGEGFIEIIKEFACTKLLIGDEVHGLGSQGFINNPPDFFDYRLGLSATPVRQYDEGGTEALFTYFGPTVFQFTLEDAIGKCLVEYDYFVHFVNLNEAEMEKWMDLTEEIKRLSSYTQNSSKKKELDKKLKSKMRARREVIENAEAKLNKFEELISKDQNLIHTLVYASDKNRAQLKSVNKILQDRGVIAYQLTFEETGDLKKTNNIIKSFKEGQLKVITAMRVLDEGINIPEIKKAYILASTTVERQWVQRRGRLLRTCKNIHKEASEIHDFFVIPQGIDITRQDQEIEEDARKMIAGEGKRVLEFATKARNTRGSNLCTALSFLSTYI